MIKIFHLLSLCMFFSLTPAALAMDTHEDSASQVGSAKKRKRHEKQTEPQRKRQGVQACERCYVLKIRCNEEKPCQKCVKAGVCCKPRTSFGLHRPGAKPSTIAITGSSAHKPNPPAETSFECCCPNSCESDTSMVDESDISILEIAPSDISQVDNSDREPSREDDDSCDDNTCYPETPHYVYFSGEFVYSMGAIPYYDPSLADIQFLPGFGGDDQ